jgi:hypothetical protein
LPGFGGGARLASNELFLGLTSISDIDYGAFLANDRTLADPEVIRNERPTRLTRRRVLAVSRPRSSSIALRHSISITDPVVPAMRRS